MPNVSKAVAPRKLRVTVTVEEFDSPKSTEPANSKEMWMGNFLRKQIVNLGIEKLHRLFSWLF